MTTHDPIPARLAALKTTTTPDLKQQWRELFDSEPPPFNRRYLESRLAYRIQELAYGGLKPETVDRLVALGEQLDGGNVVLRRIRADSRPLLVDIEMPTLVIVGREDRVTPLERARQMATDIANARLEVIDDSGHMTPLEKPAEVSAALRRWLTQ